MQPATPEPNQDAKQTNAANPIAALRQPSTVNRQRMEQARGTQESKGSVIHESSKR